MSFAILRIKKHKSINAIIGVARHHNREIDVPNADKSRAQKNIRALGAQKDSKQLGNLIKSHIESYQQKQKRKFRSDAVKAVEFMMSASPEFFKTASKKHQQQFLELCKKYLEKKFGAENVLGIWLHLDESTPHIHAMIVPIDKKGVLNAREFFGSAEKLSNMQTEFAQQVEHLGLQRGIKGSKAKHVPVAKFWQRLATEPKLQPSKADYAKAAMGFDVPIIKKIEQQASQYIELKEQSKVFFENAVSFSRKKRALEIDLNSFRVQQELFTKDNYIVDALKRENQMLKSRISTFDIPKTPFNYDRIGL